MPTYTTETNVRARLVKNSTQVSSSAVEEMINQAEFMIKALMRGKFTATYDSTKHGLLTKATTELAAFSLLTADPSTFTSITEASIIADLLWNSIEQNEKLLSDERIVTYLNGL